MGAEWCGFRFPDHVNYFTPTSLKALATSIGYEFRWMNRLSLFDDNLIVELKKPRRPAQKAAVDSGSRRLTQELAPTV